ncbi:acetyltransferase [uncultured Pantoea sp.]|uniref:acetyltransferase n=1 Tax=uncultured Pantoea sp. TaxID=218084 RepID=UPI0025E4DC88|nr:acetyltransferase [uncultured Pantoea sp.]
MNEKPIVIIGGGGHASVLYDILMSQKREILAVISPTKTVNKIFDNILHLKSDDLILEYSPKKILLVNGIGQLPNSILKKEINKKYISLGYEFESVISDNAMISSFARFGSGVQIMHGTVIQAGAEIGNHSIVNTKAVVEHDSVIGDYCFLAPNSTICGNVTLGNDVFIGAGSTIIQNLTVGNGSTVGAGALLTKNLLDGSVCYPVKAKIMSRENKD